MTHDRKPAGMGSLAPNQLLILNGVNTSLISRSLHNVLTNFLTLRCVMMEKGPMYGNCPYEQHSNNNNNNNNNNNSNNSNNNNNNHDDDEEEEDNDNDNNYITLS